MGFSLSPEWGAVVAVALLFALVAATHVLNVRIGD